MQQYEKLNGSYSQEEMLEFDKQKLAEAEHIRRKGLYHEQMRAVEEIQILTRDIQERTELLLGDDFDDMTDLDGLNMD